MLKETIRKIKSIEIQGATNVAKAAIREMKETLKKNPRKIKYVSKLLMNSRPTEPLMRNGIRYILSGNSVEEMIKNADEFLDLVKKADENISLIGSNFIKKNSVVYTHCHSSTVVSILRKAKKKIKYVINSETRPRFQGRITARELSDSGIKVIHIVDSAVADMTKKIDIAIVGSDCITPTHFVNKVGTLGISMIMRDSNIPMFVASTLLKFDPETLIKPEKIEIRDPKEVWKNPPKNVRIYNPAFDLVPNEYVNFITEFGIISSDQIFDFVEKNYPFMLRNIYKL